ncbi:hypothetical protein JCM1840_004245 [Sporobolomyces johnsonii]
MLLPRNSASTPQSSATTTDQSSGSSLAIVLSLCFGSVLLVWIWAFLLWFHHKHHDAERQGKKLQKELPKPSERGRWWSRKRPELDVDTESAVNEDVVDKLKLGGEDLVVPHATPSFPPRPFKLVRVPPSA